MLHVAVPDQVGGGTEQANRFFEKCRKHAKMRSRTDRRRHVANGNGWTNGGIPRSARRRLRREMPLLLECIAKVARNEALFTRDGKRFVTFLNFPRNDVRATDVNCVLLWVFLLKFSLRVKMRVKTWVQSVVRKSMYVRGFMCGL